MEQIFSQLKGIIILALPTTLLVLLLHFYLKKVLFQPLEKVLEERMRRTEGAVSDSEALVDRAAGKMKAYETAMAEARSGLYRELEENRGRLSAAQSSALKDARGAAEQNLAAAKAEIAAEADQARAMLTSEASRLADEITLGILAKEGRV